MISDSSEGSAEQVTYNVRGQDVNLTAGFPQESSPRAESQDDLDISASCSSDISDSLSEEEGDMPAAVRIPAPVEAASFSKSVSGAYRDRAITRLQTISRGTPSPTPKVTRPRITVVLNQRLSSDSDEE